MYDGNEAIHLALALRDQFDSPAEMLASLDANMELSDDVSYVVGRLALYNDPIGIAWLASVFYAAGRIDRDNEESRARAYACYSSRAGERNRSATCRPNSDASL